jgi:hypothetical protein
MKTLLAVVNCHTRQIYQDTIRETWLPLVPDSVDVRFFRGMGAQREPLKDEVFLDCGDSYSSLPDKIRAIARWALTQQYDVIVKLDDDCILRPEAFLNTSFQNYDFTGRTNYTSARYPVPMGFCYSMSKRVLQLVANAELPKDNKDEVWIAKVLERANIALHQEPRYCLYTGNSDDYLTTNRSLRAGAPKCTKFALEGANYYVVWCMFINWSGFHTIPDEKIVVEMRKVFKHVC